ncbi:MAG: anthranilate synthase component I family protein [Flavobacteriales bacterium]
MRRSIDLDPGLPLLPALLREEEQFLFRRVADQQRTVLCVGEQEVLPGPPCDLHGPVNDWCTLSIDYEWLLPDGSEAPHNDGAPCVRWTRPRWVVDRHPDRAVLHVHPDSGVDPADLAHRLVTGIHDPGERLETDWKLTTDKATYLANVELLLRHVQRGDIYEVNYCTERTALWPQLEPYVAFLRLLQRSGAPFAAFHRLGDRFVLSASPERFLAFDGPRVVGEPMKGTRPRSPDPDTDDRLRQELMSDAKERSENIMALDVMRHDLSRIADRASVVVNELCAVRTYPRVHQLVSTVSARMAPGVTVEQVVRAAFPMASMTGAPKERAMELIAGVEGAPRGAFSGTLGFFAPDGTADLNVVIRALVFDRRTGVVSLRTGSALTALCDPAAEWEECQVKARSVIDALAHA